MLTALHSSLRLGRVAGRNTCSTKIHIFIWNLLRKGGNSAKDIFLLPGFGNRQHENISHSLIFFFTDSAIFFITLTLPHSYRLHAVLSMVFAHHTIALAGSVRAILLYVRAILLYVRAIFPAHITAYNKRDLFSPHLNLLHHICGQCFSACFGGMRGSWQACEMLTCKKKKYWRHFFGTRGSWQARAMLTSTTLSPWPMVSLRSL